MKPKRKGPPDDPKSEDECAFFLVKDHDDGVERLAVVLRFTGFLDPDGTQHDNPTRDRGVYVFHNADAVHRFARELVTHAGRLAG